MLVFPPFQRGEKKRGLWKILSILGAMVRGVKKGLKMAVRVVRLGSERAKDEGLRIGTVRRPPRGVPKSEFSKQNWYDVWLPNLAPDSETIKLGQAAVSERDGQQLVTKYRKQMSTPDNTHLLELLAIMSHNSNFSVGCYCANAARCHRSVLKELLLEKGAVLAE